MLREEPIAVQIFPIEQGENRVVSFSETGDLEKERRRNESVSEHTLENTNRDSHDVIGVRIASRSRERATRTAQTASVAAIVNRSKIVTCTSPIFASARAQSVDVRERRRTDFVSDDLPFISSNDGNSRSTRRLTSLTRRGDSTQLTQPSDSDCTIDERQSVTINERKKGELETHLRNSFDKQSSNAKVPPSLLHLYLLSTD